MAWEVLHDPDKAAHLTAEQVLEQCRRAGYGEEASQKAATRHGFERLKQGLSP